MAVSRTVNAGAAKAKKRSARSSPGSSSSPSRSPAARSAPSTETIRIGDLSEFLGYSLKRAQLRIFDDFIRCVATLQLTPAQFSVLMLVEANPGRNQTEIASTLGILRPNFVAMLDELESRELCIRVRSNSDRRSHILKLTDKGRAVLSRARKLIETRHEARLKQLLGEDNRDLLLVMLRKIAQEF